MDGPERSKESTSSTAGLVSDKRLDAVYARVSWVLMPTYMLVVVLNQLDRNNIAFAALTLNRDLGFTASVYGLGSAMFFVTMVLCQVPSNFIMLRVGVPRWLGFLVFAWGVVATCCAAIHNQTTFFVLRLLLGAFESGAHPAMWYSLSQFYPQERLTKPYMYLTSGVLIAAILGAPLAAGFLSMNGLAGLRGWQWLFILEGIPSVLLGIALVLFLPDSPAHAWWLSVEHKELLKADMLRNQAASPPRHLIARRPLQLMKMVLSNPLLPFPVFIGFSVSMASYAFLFFAPIIINALLHGSQGLTNVKAAAAAGQLELIPIVLVSVPCAVAAVVAWVVAASSQKRNEPFWHSGVGLGLGGLMFMLFPVMGRASIAAGFIALVIISSAVASANGPLMSVVSRVCKGPSQAIGMPFYNSLALIGGFVGPYVTGHLLQRPSGLAISFTVVGALLLAAAGMMVVLRSVLLKHERAESLQSCPQVLVASSVSTEASASEARECGEARCRAGCKDHQGGMVAEAATAKDVEMGVGAK